MTRRKGVEEKEETRSQRHRRRQRQEQDAVRAALTRLDDDGQLDRLFDDPGELEVLRRFLGRRA